VGEAGESARVEAERVRRQLAETLAKADRLAKRIDRFQAGEEGERTTAEALACLPAAFVVHHDLRIDGSDANVDHVVVGPTGVYVIDSKHWSGRVSIGRGTLWSGRHPQRRALTNLAWEAACVAGSLTATGAGVPVSVISVTGSGRGDRAFEIDGTWILPVEMVPDFLTAGPSRVPAGAVQRASEALCARRLPCARYPSDPLSDPARSPAHRAPEPRYPLSVPLAPARRNQPTVAPPPTGPGSSSAAPRRTPGAPNYSSARPRPFPTPWPSSGTPRSRRRRPEQTKRAAQLALGVLLIAVAGPALRYLPRLSHVASSLMPTPPMTATPAPPPGGTSSAVAPLNIAWSCPEPGAGWTATFTLASSEQARLGTWELQVATSESGPWTTKGVGEGDMRLTSLQPERPVWIRGGNISSLQIAGHPIIEGRLTTPPGC
jgi:hypothetical protein